MKRLGWIAVGIFGLAGLAGVAQGQDTQGMVQREIARLQFDGGGSPLTSAERQEAAGIVALAMRTNAAKWTELDRGNQPLLAALARHDPALDGFVWDQQRYAYLFNGGIDPQFATVAAMERRILDAHDPVVVMDAAHGRAVTVHMLASLRGAANVIAVGYKLPPPAGDFDAIVREEVRNLSTLDPPIADGFAHVTRNAPQLGRWLGAATPAARVSFFANRDKVFHGVEDHRAEQWQIAEAAAMMAGYAAKHAPSGGSGAYGARMQNHVLGDAVRGYSPNCNPSLSASSRASSGCTSAVPVPGLPWGG